MQFTKNHVTNNKKSESDSDSEFWIFPLYQVGVRMCVAFK
jgi:hypothetical protein